MTQKAATVLGKSVNQLVYDPSFNDIPASTNYTTRAEAAKITYALLAIDYAGEAELRSPS